MPSIPPFYYRWEIVLGWKDAVMIPCTSSLMEKTWDQQPLQWRRYKYAAISVNMSIFSVVQSAHPLLFQNVYAVLDLYGKVTAVSIVSSTLVEDSESVKAPSLSADSYSEGEEDSTPVREVCLHILKLDWLYFNVKLYWCLFVFQLRVRMSLPWCPPSWLLWRIMEKISSCPIRTWLPPGCPATTRVFWSQLKLCRASSSSRCVFVWVYLEVRDTSLYDANSFLPQFQIDRLNPSWTSSLSLGVIGHSPDRLNFPSTACCLKRSVWLLQRDSVFHNSLKVMSLPLFGSFILLSLIFTS